MAKTRKNGAWWKPNLEQWRRSIVKAVTYRLLIISLDVGFIYFLTGKLSVAFWFTVASNVYTTVAYLVHERIWDRISWGRKKESAPA